jgi:hypothetical protein
MTTWHLHEDTHRRTRGRLYTGTTKDASFCQTGAAAEATCPGPGRISAYMGGFFVHDQEEHVLRTGDFDGWCDSPWRASFEQQLRWASGRRWDWTPEYRLAGRVHVVAQHRRGSNGLVFHPVHRSNCNNYYVKVWRKDDSELWSAEGRAVWLGRETAQPGSTRSDYRIIARGLLPEAPAEGVWHDYRIDVLPDAAFAVRWNGEPVTFEYFDQDQQTFTGVRTTTPRDSQRWWVRGGPVGFRSDHFDLLLDDTRVHAPAPQGDTAWTLKA